MAGSGTGTYRFASAANGIRLPAIGSSAGTYGWVSGANAIPGTYGWAATATGTRTPKASATGAYGWASATGEPLSPWAAGVYGWASASVGLRTPKGAAAGFRSVIGRAAGVKSPLPPLPPAPGGRQLISNLAGDPADWVMVGAATITTTGIVDVPATNAYSDWAQSASNYDLTGSSMMVRLVQPPVNHSGNECYMWLQDMTANNAYAIGWMGGLLQYFAFIAGGWTAPGAVNTENTPQAITSTDQWLRIREFNGIIYWEISPDSLAWNTIHQQPRDFTITDMQAQLGAGCFGADTTAGTAIFDRINSPATGPDVLQPEPENVGLLLVEISSALNDLGDSTSTPDPRITPAVAMLSKINSEWSRNPTQAAADANTLAFQIAALLASYPTANRLADALDCAQQLAGTWSGDDYV